MSTTKEFFEGKPLGELNDEQLTVLLKQPVAPELVFGDRLIRSLIADAQCRVETSTSNRGNTSIVISSEKLRDVEELLVQLPPGPSSELLGQLNEYSILDIIGTGGMGIVLSARDTNLDREVAIKVMKPSHARRQDARERFVREARAAAAIQHDNVVAIYHVGCIVDTPYFVMPLLKGETLRQRMQRQTLEPAEILDISQQVAAGLSAAHRRDLLHRDIKPENIWLESESNRAKILDFGIAKFADMDASLTASGTFMGTLNYVSPELVNGSPTDTRSDLFSLGVVIYEMLSGIKPFERDSFVSTVHAIAFEPFPPLELRNDHIGNCLIALANDLLAKDPNDRPPNAIAVVSKLDDLKIWLDSQSNKNTHRKGSDSWPRLMRSNLSKKNAIIAAGVVAMLLFGSLLMSIAMQDGKGTLVVIATGGFNISTIDDEIRVRDLASGREYRMQSGENRLKPGEYAVVVTSDDGLQFSTEKFSIVRNGVENLSVSVAPPELHPSPDLVPAFKNPINFVMGAPAIPGATSWTMETRFHRGYVTAIGLDREEKYLASCGMDGTVRLWDPANFQLQRILLDHRFAVRGLAWSPTEDLLATFDTTEIIVWDIKTFNSIRRLPATLEPHTELNWSGDGHYLSIVDAKGNVLIWNLSDGQLRNQIGPDINDAHWLDGGTDLFIHRKDGVSEIRNALTSKSIEARPSFSANTLAQYSPDNLRVAQCYNAVVSIIDANNGDLLTTIEDATARVILMWWLPDSKSLLTLHEGGALKLWNTESKEILGEFPDSALGHHKHLRVCFSKKKEGVFFVSTFLNDSRSGLSRFGNGAEPPFTGSLSYGQQGADDCGQVIYDFFFSQDKERIVVSALRGFDIWKTNTGEHINSVVTGNTQAGAINELDDGKILLVDTDEGGGLRQISYLDPETYVDMQQTPPSTIMYQGDLPGSVPLRTVSPDSGYFAFYCPTLNKKLIWGKADSELRKSIPVDEMLPLWQPHTIRMSNGPDPKLGLAVYAGDRYALLDISGQKGEPLFRIENLGSEVMFDWSPDKKLLFMVNARGELEVHDGETGGLLKHPLNDHPVVRWAWSANGQKIVLLGRDNIGRLWDVQKQEFVESFRMDFAGSRVLKWSPDGQYIGNVSEQGNLTIHSSETGDRTGLLVYANFQNAYWFSNNGHFKTLVNQSKPTAESEIRSVIVRPNGEQATFDLIEFSSRFQWRNDWK